MKTNRLVITVATLMIAQGVPAFGQSAWLPEPGELIANPGFTFSTFDEFWVGPTLMSPLKANDESLDQYTAYIGLEYGILDGLAADLSLGYTWTSKTAALGDGDEGLADVLFGLSYRLVEEREILPTVALRVGGIIAGSYDENTPFSPGDGANGFDGSLLFGKSFGDSGFGVYGDVGYRVRENPVPNEWFGSAGLFKQFGGLLNPEDSLTFSVGYRHIQSINGLDIGGAGFDPAKGADHGFPALEEVNQLFEAAVGYEDAAARQYQFTVSRSVDGRNTGDKLILGFSISLPF